MKNYSILFSLSVSVFFFSCADREIIIFLLIIISSCKLTTATFANILCLTNGVASFCLLLKNSVHFHVLALPVSIPCL